MSRPRNTQPVTSDQLHRGERGDRGRTRAAVEQRDLAEEVAGPQLRLALAPDRDLALALEDHEQTDAALALSGDHRPLPVRDLLGRAPDQAQLAPGALGEQRDAADLRHDLWIASARSDLLRGRVRPSRSSAFPGTRILSRRDAARGPQARAPPRERMGAVADVSEGRRFLAIVVLLLVGFGMVALADALDEWWPLFVTDPVRDHPVADRPSRARGRRSVSERARPGV